ncbi:unnamed protein product [Penicillium salamii]|nr:unnamed protein product [Penicillium salamii]
MRLVFIFVALCLTVFLVALGQTIIATAIPTIISEFHSAEDIGWHGSAFLLTTCSFQLFPGKLYTLLPLKCTFVGAVLFFKIGSAICGASPNSVALMIGRNIAGMIARAPQIDPSVVLQAGATDLQQTVSQAISSLGLDKDVLTRVLEIYSDAIVQTFMVALVIACISIIGALGVEWREVFIELGVPIHWIRASQYQRETSTQSAGHFADSQVGNMNSRSTLPTGGNNQARLVALLSDSTYDQLRRELLILQGDLAQDLLP